MAAAAAEGSARVAAAHGWRGGTAGMAVGPPTERTGGTRCGRRYAIRA